MSNYEIDRAKIMPGIDAKIERLNAKLRAAGKMQDQPAEQVPAPIPSTAIATEPGAYVAPEQCFDAADSVWPPVTGSEIKKLQEKVPAPTVGLTTKQIDDLIELIRSTPG